MNKTRIHYLTLIGLLSTFTILLLTNCAHYYTSDIKSEVVRKTKLDYPICLQPGAGTLPEKYASANLEEDNKAHGGIIKMIRKKYPGLIYDCKAEKKIVIKYSMTQKHLNIGAFYATLGIIPSFSPTDFKVSAYDVNNNLTYESKREGKVVMSIFFIPFFFLHDSGEEIIFQEVDRYLSQAV